MRVALTVLSNRGQSPAFTRCLAGLVSYCAMQGKSFGLDGYSVNIAGNVSLLSKGRQDAIAQARAQSCTHLLFIDDDMEFPVTALELLAQRNVSAIGVNYIRKNPEKPSFVASDMKSHPISSVSKSGVEAVGHIGLGLFLLELSALQAVPAPYFEVRWNSATQDYDSEDTYFCEKLRAHGIPVYVDHDLSQAIGHLGEISYSPHLFPEVT